MRKLLMPNVAANVDVLKQHIEQLTRGEHLALLLARCDVRSPPIVRITAHTKAVGFTLRASTPDGDSLSLVSVAHAAQLALGVTRNPPIDVDLTRLQLATRWRVRLRGSRPNAVHLYAEQDN